MQARLHLPAIDGPRPLATLAYGLGNGHMTDGSKILTEMNDRSREVFRRVVEGYLASGDPVGSRTLRVTVELLSSMRFSISLLSIICIASVIGRAQGFHGAKVNRGIESPERYVLMIYWTTLENHTVDFRQSDAFTQWRAIVGPFFAGPPTVEHFELVAKSV